MPWIPRGKWNPCSRASLRSNGNEISLGERLPQEENQQEKVVENRMFLEQALNMLDKGEEEGKRTDLSPVFPKTEPRAVFVPGELGMSQVQVSRMEKKILKQEPWEKL